MINNKQLRENVIRPILKRFDLYSKAAEELLIGTTAVEAIIDGEHYLHQIHGPALGIYQMEPATHNWMCDYILSKRTKFQSLIDWINNTGGFDVNRLSYDLFYMTIMTRMRYRVVPKALPDESDITGLANYWKTYYNTEHGAGTVEGFIWKYNGYNGIK